MTNSGQYSCYIDNKEFLTKIFLAVQLGICVSMGRVAQHCIVVGKPVIQLFLFINMKI